MLLDLSTTYLRGGYTRVKACEKGGPHAGANASVLLQADEKHRSAVTVHADLVDPLGLGMGELLVTVDTEAEENGIPAQIREELKLVQINVARGVPQLEIDVLAIDLDALVE